MKFPLRCFFLSNWLRICHFHQKFREFFPESAIQLWPWMATAQPSKSHTMATAHTHTQYVFLLLHKWSRRRGVLTVTKALKIQFFLNANMILLPLQGVYDLVWNEIFQNYFLRFLKIMFPLVVHMYTTYFGVDDAAKISESRSSSRRVEEIAHPQHQQSMHVCVFIFYASYSIWRAIFVNTVCIRTGMICARICLRIYKYSDT